MLGLQLRQEFLTEQMPTAAATFHMRDGMGVLDMTPAAFFAITYPSLDIQRGLYAIAQRPEGRPIVLIAERGRGKTHVMAAIHHALQTPENTDEWLAQWQGRGDVDLNIIKGITLRRGYMPITESLQDNEYPHLWDVLFTNHPSGERFKGRFEASGENMPSRSLIEGLLETQPAALILDELQTWYEGRQDREGNRGAKYRSWAFNFIQMLAEIATDRPDLLLFIASVRNNDTDAYRQIHRNNPRIIDFKELEARVDRQRLVLHRLFANRASVPDDQVATATAAYRSERFRLLIQPKQGSGEADSDVEVMRAWPFTPELFTILEDQILKSNNAQGLRDLLRTLAYTFRSWGEAVVVLSPVRFNITAAESRNVDALLDAIALSSQSKLREVAKRNYDGLISTIQGFSQAQVAEVISDIWMRSFAAEAQIGAVPAQLQLDMTHAEAIDDNVFNDLLNQIMSNAFNIHQTQDGDQRRLLFREEENARAVLMARARNDQLFSEGQEIRYLRQYLRNQLSPAASQTTARVIVLGPDWESTPWDEPNDAPDQWDRPILLVLPALPRNLNATLGQWLARNVSRRRNTIRFLLPENDLFADEQLRQVARVCYLIDHWNEAKFSAYRSEFMQKLSRLVNERFTRFAILKQWNYQSPSRCVFTVESLREPISGIATKLDKILRDDFFMQEEFQRRAIALAAETKTVGILLDGLLEPPGDPHEDALVYLSERDLTEQLLLLIANAAIALNVQGTWLVRQSGESVVDALNRLKMVGFKSGRELREVMLGLPAMVGAGTQGGQVHVPPQLPNPPGGTIFEPPIPPQYPPPVIMSPIPPRDLGGVAPPQPLRQRKQHRSAQPKHPINLSGELEQWGIDARATIPVVRLEFTRLSAGQLRDILSHLPATISAVLEVESDEEVQG